MGVEVTAFVDSRVCCGRYTGNHHDCHYPDPPRSVPVVRPAQSMRHGNGTRKRTKAGTVLVHPGQFQRRAIGAHSRERAQPSLHLRSLRDNAGPALIGRLQNVYFEPNLLTFL